MHTLTPIHPQARSEKLIAQPVGKEVVIYDERSLKIHRLNTVSAAIWRACNGHRSAAEVLTVARREVGTALTIGDVERALDRLFKTALVEEVPTKRRRAVPPSRRTGRQRRQTGAYAPVVTTIVAPTPIMAASGGKCGEPCISGVECAGATDGCIYCSTEVAQARPGPDGKINPVAIVGQCIDTPPV